MEEGFYKMSNEWDDLPKMNMSDDDLPKLNVSDDLPKLSVSSEDFGFSETHSSLGSFPENDEYSYNSTSKKYEDDKTISIELEKPTENSKQKIALFFAAVFFIITIPICCNMYKNFTQLQNYMGEQQSLEVTVKNFKPQELYTISEATGTVVPESSVDVVARVEGYLEKTFFKEGDNIKKGQLLFKIESVEYEIAVRAAEAAVAQAQALYTNALQELDRGKELIKENFISRSDYDAMVASANSAKASLDEVKQSLARARLNLNYTKILAPISGKAGTIALSDGNYVGIGSGALVNIAKTNPICVSFSMKSSDVINMKQGDSGKLDLKTAKVELILSDDSKYKYVGKINFANNYVSSDAASLALKAVFDNPDKLLIPGDYVKVIVTAEKPLYKILVPQSAVRGDAMNGYYVWTAVANKTVKKPIKVSNSRDNYWVVESGVTEADDIIINSNISVDMDNMDIAKITRSQPLK